MKMFFRTCLALGFCVVTADLASAAREPIPVRTGNPYRGAIVIDADTGKVLAEDKADDIVYPASVIKLLTAAVVMDEVNSGKINLQDMVQVTKEAMDMGGSQVYLDVRETFPVEELLFALLIQSANDAAVALAIHVAGSKDEFVVRMNKKAQELGMKSTRVHSPHGLPPSAGFSPDVTTARDIATLGRALLAYPKLMEIAGTRERPFRNGEFMLRTHNKLLQTFPGCTGLKTGFYSAAGFSIAASAEQDGKRVVAAIMGSMEKNVRDRVTAEWLSKGFAGLR